MLKFFLSCHEFSYLTGSNFIFLGSLDGLPFQNEEFDFVYVIFLVRCWVRKMLTKCIIGILNG